MERLLAALNRKNAILLFSGFIQVFLISVNSYFIFKVWFLGVTLASFLISLNWTFNVRKITASTTEERLSYSFGAAAGAAIGLYFSILIFKLFN